MTPVIMLFSVFIFSFLQLAALFCIVYVLFLLVALPVKAFWRMISQFIAI